MWVSLAVFLVIKGEGIFSAYANWSIFTSAGLFLNLNGNESVKMIEPPLPGGCTALFH